jgi:hypothetical protein
MAHRSRVGCVAARILALVSAGTGPKAVGLGDGGVVRVPDPVDLGMEALVVAGDRHRPEHDLAVCGEPPIGDVAGLVGVQIDEPCREAGRVGEERLARTVGDVDDVLEPGRGRPAGLGERSRSAVLRRSSGR